MYEWITPIGTFLAGAAGAVVVYDRIQKYRKRIGHDFHVEFHKPLKPKTNDWTPGETDLDSPDYLSISGTIYNNSDEPIVLEEWECHTAPIPSPRIKVRPITEVEPGATAKLRTAMKPDWVEWDQRLSSGRTSPDDGRVDISIIALFRASSKRERIRAVRYSIPHTIIKKNAVKALKISADIE